MKIQLTPADLTPKAFAIYSNSQLDIDRTAKTKEELIDFYETLAAEESED